MKTRTFIELSIVAGVIVVGYLGYQAYQAGKNEISGLETALSNDISPTYWWNKLEAWWDGPTDSSNSTTN